MRSRKEIIHIIIDERKKQKISLRDLERLTNISKSSLSRYENDPDTFPINKINTFANALNLTKEFLSGDNESKLIKNFIKIPIIKNNIHKLPILNDSNIDNYQLFPMNLLPKIKENQYFFYKNKDIDMKKSIGTNSLVLIRIQKIKNNDIVALLIDKKIILRKINKINNQTLLLSDKDTNPFIKPSNSKILGKVIKVIKNF